MKTLMMIDYLGEWTRVFPRVDVESEAEVESFHESNFAAWLSLTRDIERRTGTGALIGLEDAWAMPPYPMSGDTEEGTHARFGRVSRLKKGLSAQDSDLVHFVDRFEHIATFFPGQSGLPTTTDLFAIAAARDQWSRIELSAAAQTFVAVSEWTFGGNRLSLALHASVAEALLAQWRGRWEISHQ